MKSSGHSCRCCGLVAKPRHCRRPITRRLVWPPLSSQQILLGAPGSERLAGRDRLIGTTSHPEVPFGGYQQSGLGRENGLQTIEHFTQTKTIYANLGAVGSLISSA